MKNYLFLTFFALILFSCARVGSPVGGDKDTLAPKFLGSNIDSPRVNVQRDLHELRLDFDEYVKLKDINKNLIISPPITQISKILPSALSTKFVLIQWKDTLKANTTYSFNFGNSIQDNNEGNPLPYFNYAFSTGPKIDSLYLSGVVKDGFPTQKTNSTDKENNFVVGLYQAKDSINYFQKPYYITKVDPDGYYEFNYLAPGKYKILAFDDANGNSVFDNGKEKIAFKKETIDLSKSLSGLDFTLFNSKPPLKYLEWKPEVGGILFLFEGNPEQLAFAPADNLIKDFKIVHRPKSDSLHFYFDAKKENIGIAGSQKLKFKYELGAKKDTISLFYKFDDTAEMALSNQNGNLLPPNQDFVIYSNLPVDQIQPEKFFLISDSLKQNFAATISATNPHHILINSDFKEGKKYQLTIPKGSVNSYFNTITKSYQFNFEIDKSQNFGSFTLNLENKPAHPFWIQLVDTSGKVVYEKKLADASVKFTELKPGNYTIRILVDNNENGSWDTADFASQTYAEDVYKFYKKLVVKPFWEIVETWDLNRVLTDEEEENLETQPVQTETAPPLPERKLNPTKTEILKGNNKTLPQPQDR